MVQHIPCIDQADGSYVDSILTETNTVVENRSYQQESRIRTMDFQMIC